MNGQGWEFGVRDLEAGCLVLIKNQAFASDFSLLLLILPARAVGGVRAGTMNRRFLSVTSVRGGGRRAHRGRFRQDRLGALP